MGKVTIQGEISDLFDIQRGVRQGDALSTILFNIVLERSVRKMAINPGGTIYNRYWPTQMISSLLVDRFKNCKQVSLN